MKKAFALLLCLLLVFTLCPAALAESAEGEGESHSCSGLVFDRPLSGVISGTLEPGNYYLTDTATVHGHVKITGEVNLCLNGYPVSIQSSNTFLVCDGGVFSIYDCDGDGLIGHYQTTLHNHPLTVQAGGTANVYGGWLYGKDGSNAINSHGTVNIYGGKIESGWDYHCAVRNEGVLNLYGGELIGYFGISQRYGAQLNFCGSDFKIDSKAKALQYVSAQAPLVIETPAYRWRTEKGGEFTASDVEPFAVSESDVYVEFAPLRYSIRYELDGGRIEGEASEEYLVGEGCPLPDTVVKEGFVFTGWIISDGGGIVTEIGPERSGNLTLWAMYDEAPAPTPEPTLPEEEEELPAAEDPDDGKPASALFVGILAAALAMLALGLFLVIRHWKHRS